MSDSVVVLLIPVTYFAFRLRTRDKLSWVANRPPIILVVERGHLRPFAPSDLFKAYFRFSFHRVHRDGEAHRPRARHKNSFLAWTEKWFAHPSPQPLIPTPFPPPPRTRPPSPSAGPHTRKATETSEITFACYFIYVERLTQWHGPKYICGKAYTDRHEPKFDT